MTIKFYRTRDEFGAFSNFAPYPITLDGYLFRSSEHAYQAAKHVPGGERFMEIFRALSAHEAARLGRLEDLPIRSDWGDVKISIMDRILRAKFSQHPDLAELLLSTGEEEIIEDSPTDTFWGAHEGIGQNELGKCLMRLRDELRNKSE